jgi:hypothetical protein
MGGARHKGQRKRKRRRKIQSHVTDNRTFSIPIDDGTAVIVSFRMSTLLANLRGGEEEELKTIITAD